MQLFAAITGAVLMLPSVLAASPPSYFLVETSNAQGAQASKFNGLFLNPSFTVGGKDSTPIFSEEEGGATFYSFNQSSAAVNGQDFYTLQTQTKPQSTPNRLNMLYDLVSFANWQPAMFQKGSTANTTDGFYLNGTKLLWTNDFKKPSGGDFYGWLVCDWWVTVPQLFFLTQPDVTKIPSICAKVDLNVIPIDGKA